MGGNRTLRYLGPRCRPTRCPRAFHGPSVPGAARRGGRSRTSSPTSPSARSASRSSWSCWRSSIGLLITLPLALPVIWLLFVVSRGMGVRGAVPVRCAARRRDRRSRAAPHGRDVVGPLPGADPLPPALARDRVPGAPAPARRRDVRRGRRRVVRARSRSSCCPPTSRRCPAARRSSASSRSGRGRRAIGAAVVGLIGIVLVAPWLTVLLGRLDTAVARAGCSGRAGVLAQEARLREARDAAASPRSTARKPSAAASNATCTTARSSGWSPGDGPRLGPRAARRTTPRAGRELVDARARGGEGGAAGAPRPRPRHPPGDPRGPWPRRRAVGGRRARPGARVARGRRRPERPSAASRERGYFVVVRGADQRGQALAAPPTQRCRITRRRRHARRRGARQRRRRRRRRRRRHRSRRVCATASRRSTGRCRSTAPPAVPTTLRAVLPCESMIAEDSVLLREGLTRLLADAGDEVVAAVGDADALLDAVERRPARPRRRRRAHAADAHRRGRARRDRRSAHAVARGRRSSCSRSTSRSATPPSCSRATSAASATCSRTGSPTSRDFVDAVRRVGDGGTVLDPEVVSQLLARARRRDPLERLTPRERDGARR